MMNDDDVIPIEVANAKHCEDKNSRKSAVLLERNHEGVLWWLNWCPRRRYCSSNLVVDKSNRVSHRVREVSPHLGLVRKSSVKIFITTPSPCSYHHHVNHYQHHHHVNRHHHLARRVGVWEGNLFLREKQLGTWNKQIRLVKKMWSNCWRFVLLKMVGQGNDDKA